MSIAENLRGVRERIAAACARVGRDPREITLVAVSKTFPPAAVREAAAAGQTVFGENYVQEAREKIPGIGVPGLSWHFIGHLQSNKAKYAARLFDMIETVDSVSLAQELGRRAQAAGRVLDVLLQIDLAGEAQKSGAAPEDAEVLLRGTVQVSGLRVRGLMTMPPFLPPEEVRPYFARLRALRDHLATLAIPGTELTELSMGMSGDFEVAIEEGATIVRVGTAIFGARDGE